MGLLERYGWFDVASPRGLVEADALAVGLLLLGPDTLYPPHAHPAMELYHVVAGTAEWWSADGAWTAARGQLRLPPAPGAALHADGIRADAGPLRLALGLARRPDDERPAHGRRARSVDVAAEAAPPLSGPLIGSDSG